LTGSYMPLRGASHQGWLGAVRGAIRFVVACAVAALAGVATAAWFIARGPHFEAAAAAASSAAFALLLSMALFAGRIVTRDARRHAPEAQLPAEWTERLHQLMRSTLHMDLNEAPGRQLADLVHRAFNLEAVAVYDADLGEIYRAGLWQDDPQEIAQNAFHFESSDDDPKTGLHRRVVSLGTVPVGSIIARGDADPLAITFAASLIAITFDRYRAAANETRLEAERRAEQLRAAVLDGLAHAYKTPLTAIRAASTGLAEMGRLSPAQSELVSLISEQAEQLNELTTRLLATARLESGQVTLNASPVAVGPLIDEALASLGDRRGETPIAVDLPDESLQLFCDRRLLTMLLTQYLDNACKYSNAGSPITVRAVNTGQEVVFSVHSFGPVISLADRERIFDRFYRAVGSDHRAPGTGIGLSVAKRAALIHGGTVWLSSDETEGTTFYAAIPATTTPEASR
jgi:two-component system, OmpR family, sensor histidine kinase KdpD